jgi:hypothetical protein
VSDELDAFDDEQFDAFVDVVCHGWRLGPCPLCGVFTSWDGPHADVGYAKALRMPSYRQVCGAPGVCPGLTADEIERLGNPMRPRPPWPIENGDGDEFLSVYADSATERLAAAAAAPLQLALKVRPL